MWKSSTQEIWNFFVRELAFDLRLVGGFLGLEIGCVL